MPFCPVETEYGEVEVSETIPVVESRVYMATPSLHTPKRKLPVGSMVVGLQGSLKVTVVLGSNESAPVVLLRSKAAKPVELPLLSYVSAKRKGCVVCAVPAVTRQKHVKK